MRSGWRRLSRTARVVLLGITTAAIAAAPLTISAPASAASTTASAGAKATGTVITTADGPFGTMLVVGSGKFAGYTLYLLTSDYGTSSFCNATIIKALPGGPGSCAGPSKDPKAEWPAITTDGPPVAGTGISAGLLGTIDRPGIGDQVTYAGHPLYLFDNGPGAVTGEGWDEPSLPPWHGVWWLVSPSGAALAWPGTLTTTTVGAKTVLASMMLTGIGWKPFPVYTYSKDSTSTSTCTGACAAAWPPVLTSGRAALTAGVPAASVGTIKRSEGTDQLTYRGMPLYLYGAEGIAPEGITYVALGSGNGARLDGGTFTLVSP